MYEKDYFMRVVEAFARMITIIMGFREKGELDSAYGMILEAYGSVLKVDPEELKSYTPEQWGMFCKERTPGEVEENTNSYSQARVDKITELKEKLSESDSD